MAIARHKKGMHWIQAGAQGQAADLHTSWVVRDLGQIQRLPLFRSKHSWSMRGLPGALPGDASPWVWPVLIVPELRCLGSLSRP